MTNFMNTLTFSYGLMSGVGITLCVQILRLTYRRETASRRISERIKSMPSPDSVEFEEWVEGTSEIFEEYGMMNHEYGFDEYMKDVEKRKLAPAFLEGSAVAALWIAR